MPDVLRIEELPQAPLDAAAEFHAHYLPKCINELEGNADHLVVILPSSPSDHDDWRRAVARDLGRKFAPKRANVLGGGSETARAETIAYLRVAPGVTGQYLPLHD